jgi:hypothetical protein
VPQQLRILGHAHVMLKRTFSRRLLLGAAMSAAVERAWAAITGATFNPSAPVPTAITFDPSAPSLLDSASIGAEAAAFTVTMSDGSTYTGANSLTNSAGGLFTLSASTGNAEIITAEDLPPGDSEQNVTLQASSGGTSISKGLTIAITASSGVLATLNVVNNGGTEQAANSVTQPILVCCKKGDIAAGTWPQFALSDSTVVPVTFLSALATTWSDGSLKAVPAFFSIPVAITAGASIPMFMSAGGSLPAASARSLADFSAGPDSTTIDIQEQVDGLDHLSGTWVMDLTAGINSAIKTELYGNGPAGAMWRVRANATQSGTPHGQLICDFYITSMNNANDGSPKGLRIMGKMRLPYYDSSATKNWVSFTRMQLVETVSDTVIEDSFGNDTTGWNFGPNRARTFSWTSGAYCASTHGFPISPQPDYGYGVRLTTTGALPTGYAINTTYFTQTKGASEIGFCTRSSTAIAGGTPIIPTAAGTGTQTFTPYPCLTYFGSMFTCGLTGLPNFVQGAGSDSADTMLQVQIDVPYWVSTQIIPAFDTTLTPTGANPPTSYWPNASEPCVQYFENTGSRPDIGIWPKWSTVALLTQAASDLQCARIVSLNGSQLCVGFENSATMSLPCINNGHNNAGSTYTGMPAPNPTFYWSPGNGTSSGFTDTTSTINQYQPWSANDTSHMPQFNFGAYVLTGEPWHLDGLLEAANNAIVWRGGTINSDVIINSSEFALNIGSAGSRNCAFNGTSYYGYTMYGTNNTPRDDAWGAALVAAASAICPDNHPTAAGYKQYFNDLRATPWALAAAVQAAIPSYAANLGWWEVTHSNGALISPWMVTYLIFANCFAAHACEDANALTVLKTIVLQYSYYFSKWTMWPVAAYHQMYRQSNGVTSPLIASDSQIGWEPAFKVDWTGGNSTFTAVAGGTAGNYTLTDGDAILFLLKNDISSSNCVTPPGFSSYTPYYIANANPTGYNAGTFEMSSTPDGLNIQTPTGTMAETEVAIMLRVANPPATGTSGTKVGEILGPDDYGPGIYTSLKYAIATGVDPSTISSAMTDLGNRIDAATVTWSGEVNWAFAETFG